jgi:hypothetical protein
MMMFTVLRCDKGEGLHWGGRERGAKYDDVNGAQVRQGGVAAFGRAGGGGCQVRQCIRCSGAQPVLFCPTVETRAGVILWFQQVTTLLGVQNHNPA